jgi:hypothetical protein
MNETESRMHDSDCAAIRMVNDSPLRILQNYDRGRLCHARTGEVLPLQYCLLTPELQWQSRGNWRI